MKYTVYGDANLDGTVDGTDESLVENGYASGLTGWGGGSFAYTGATTLFDESLLSGGGFTEAILFGVTAGPTTGPTTAPAFSPNGTVTGGNDVAEGSVDNNGCKGDVKITWDATLKSTGEKTAHDNSIAVTLNRTDGGTAVGTCFWVRYITRTETDANNTPITTPPYPVTISNIKTNKRVTLNRTLGQTYCDALTTYGYAAMIRTADGTVSSVDQPDDINRIAAAKGSATTTWVATEYLVVSGAVVYQVSWTCSQTWDNTKNAVVTSYSGFSSGAASQINGNPANMDLGTETGADPQELTVANPAYIKPGP